MTTDAGRHAGSAVRRSPFRPWRLALILYAIALTAGTHWPKLEMGTEEHPAPDKVIHLLAFAGLTALLWRTRWLGRLWQVAVVAAAWTALDEFSQSLPGLGRTVSPHDMLASELGVALTIVWGWALAPVGGEANRMRLRLQSVVIEQMFARPSTWVFVLIATVPCAIGLVFAWPFLTFSFRQFGPALSLSFGVSAWLAGAAAIWYLIWRRNFREALQTHPCARCRASCADAEIDEHGRGRCPRCGERFHAGQWLEPPGPSSGRMGRMLRGPILLTAGLFVAVVFVSWRLLMFLSTTTFGRGLMREWPLDLKIAVDMAVLAIIAAVGVRAYRMRLARFHDDQGATCRRCEHDLRATPTRNGIGICGECGAPFVRLSAADGVDPSASPSSNTE